ncbi:MAG: hypothetical protein AAGD14_15405 [Planctomycetota bacterium]
MQHRAWALLVFLAACGGGGGVAAPSIPALASYALPQQDSVHDVESITIEFEPGRAELSVNGGAFLPVTSPHRLESLEEGEHVLRLRAGPRSEVIFHSFAIDRTAPHVEITFPPVRSRTDQGEVVVRGRARDFVGVSAVWVNSRPAVSSDGFRTWEAVVPVTGATALHVTAFDRGGHEAVAPLRRVDAAPAPVDPAAVEAPPVDLVIDAKRGEAIVLRDDELTAYDLETADTRRVDRSGIAFVDPTVLTTVPNEDAVLVFDQHECRVVRVDLETGARSLAMDGVTGPDYRLDPAGFIATNGSRIFVQGPAGEPLGRIDVEAQFIELAAHKGWIGKTGALAWDVDRARLLAVDTRNDRLLTVNFDLLKSVTISKASIDKRIVHGRGLAIAGDVAYVVAEDGDGFVEIDLETGDRTFRHVEGVYFDGAQAVACDDDAAHLVVLDAVTQQITIVDTDDWSARVLSHLGRRARLGGPTIADPGRGEICVLDQGRRCLIAIQCDNGRTRVVHQFENQTPAAADFDLDPATGMGLLLEPRRLHRVDVTRGTVEPIGEPFERARLARLGPNGEAYVLDTEGGVHEESFGSFGYEVDCLYRVDPQTGTRTLLAEGPSYGLGRYQRTSPAVVVDAPRDRILLGSYWQRGLDVQYGTVRSVDLDSGSAITLTGLREKTENSIHFRGGGVELATPRSLAVDPKGERLFVLDERGLIVKVDAWSGSRTPISGREPYYDGVRAEWVERTHGHGPSLDRSLGLAFDASSGQLFVTQSERVVIVDPDSGHRALLTVLP